MVKDMIRELRTFPSQERRNIAISLGKLASDKAVIELKRMVDGERKRLLKWYDFEDQLIGVEALGETKRKDVLEYLRHMYTSLVSRKNISRSFPGDDGLTDTSEETFNVHNYPNAP